MKKLFSIASLALLAASMLMTGCKKDNDGNIFHLQIQQYQGQNKTTLGDNGATLWVNGDEVYVNGAEDANIATVSVSSTGATAEVTGAPVNGKYYFFYPGNATVTRFDASAKSFTYTMPSQFTFDANALKAPMAGVSNGQEVTFANLCTMLKLEFFIIPQKVVITAAENDPLCGSFTAAYGADGWTVSTSSTSNTITILNPNQSPYIYVPLPAGNHQLAITAYKETTDANALVTRSMNGSQTMAMSTLYDIPMNAHPFTVANGKQVYFSPGNLQYKNTGSHAIMPGGLSNNSAAATATGTWRFADNQWDMMLGDNLQAYRNVSGSYTFDVFCWGTSGYFYYQPTVNGSAYDLQPLIKYVKIYGSNTPVPRNIQKTPFDWGYFNAISNGGNCPKIWHTLTAEDWEALLSRNRAFLRSGISFPNSSGGSTTYKAWILFPDDFPSRIEDGNGSQISLNASSYTPDQFKVLEQHGAVLLMLAGYRQAAVGTDIYSTGGTYNISVTQLYGYYWTANQTSYTSNSARFRFVKFERNSNTWSILGGENTSVSYNAYGCSVRLVRDAN